MSGAAPIEPVITAWKAARPPVSDHQGRHRTREIVNAIRYQGRTGCQWSYMPPTCPCPARSGTTSAPGVTTAPRRRSTRSCAARPASGPGGFVRVPGFFDSCGDLVVGSL
ncbi:transposase [Streptacidiphilus sp. P02-A3a]|uniref:transposase n=1 Tax=Streptacidiphilus sp. P02-A3a TaxID=2704468 RepID=UPI0015FB2398|nr:transposase [Streptacidiphilus sp. P02-A3a]QMU70207.1 transposase [Streptacidiphilus sp. P02-A3a]